MKDLLSLEVQDRDQFSQSRPPWDSWDFLGQPGLGLGFKQQSFKPCPWHHVLVQKQQTGLCLPSEIDEPCRPQVC